MKQGTKIIKNTSVELISNIANIVLSAGFTFIIASVFGPAQYGLYYLVITFPVLFASLTILAIHCIIIMDIVKYKEKAGPICLLVLIFQ